MLATCRLARSLPAILLVGCATSMVVTPPAAPVPGLGDFRLRGVVRFEGNREYLPRLVTDDPRGRLTLSYTHETAYGGKDVPAGAALFNPLTGFGFPTGERKISVAGRLEVVTAGGEVVRSYAAVAAIEKTRSLWSDETLSEMRRRGLLAVRDSIDHQVYRDRVALEALLAQ